MKEWLRLYRAARSHAVKPSAKSRLLAWRLAWSGWYIRGPVRGWRTLVYCAMTGVRP